MLFLGSCATQKSAYQVSGEWNVTGLNGKQITPEADKTPFLGFDLNEGRVYGFTGCNRLTGAFNAAEFTKGTADFTKLGCTRMLCHDDKYETEFLSALSKVTASEVEGDKILLKDKDGKVLVTLEKKK